MAFRLPGQIDNAENFWEALSDKRDLVSEIGSDRWDTSILKHSRKSEAGKSYVFSAGQLDRIREFDAQFFGISPREAEQMDPQQRMLLELTWEALENAAVNPESLESSDCAVYVGIASNDYVQRRMDDFSSADAYSMTGSTASIASNRISYIFNLNGPSVSVDTACSSSLVAIHQACNSIWQGEASQAIVGGVNMLLHPFGFVGFSKASMLSPTGRCRAFDADGDGYVRSEGCAVFYLKPLEQAEQDGDRIHAVIVNSGVNSDGRTNGITMPSVNGQSALLKSVYEEVGIDVNEIDYIEAHGTGTAVGDPIETSAIGETLAQLRSHKHVLPIGSVKTNIGHMETASGMAGLIKAVLSLKNRAVPGNLHFKNPNPNIDFDGLNIRVVDEMMAFPDSEKPLIAGINSFGFGGTNAHVVIEEYREPQSRDIEVPEDIDPPPLFLSAASPNALKAQATQYADFLRENSAWYYDIAYQLAHKRAHLNNGLAVKSKSVSGMIRALRAFAEGEDNCPAVSQTLVEKNARVAFIYSGNGSQWLGMGRDLYAKDPFFSEKLQEVDELLSTYVDYSIIDELHAEESESRLHLTEIAQPALFAIQVGITLWLEDQGIKPKAVAGHSVGEVSAAWAAGALTLKQAVRVIVERSAAQGMTRGTGRMAAMGCGPDEVVQILKDHGLDQNLELAAVNSHKSVSLAGALPALQELEAIAEEKGFFYRILDLDYAFHSRYMEPVKERLLTSLENLRPIHTNIPMYSTVTGAKIDGREFTAQYWWDNVRQQVAFGDAISLMIDDGFHVFMDIGPHPIMRGYINECLRTANIRGMASPTLKRHSDEVQDIQHALMSVHLGGAYIDLDRHFPVPGMHIELPTYPWQREEFWHSLTEEGYNLIARQIEHPLLGYRLKQGLPQWENHLDSELVPYLADHVVGHGEVMPAAGYVEMALAASSVWYGYRHHEIEDLEIRSPLLFESDQLRTVRFELNDQSGHFTIKSRLRLSDDAWTEHAAGRILESTEDTHLPSLDVSIKPQGENLKSQEHYQIAAHIGLQYGPCFQGIDQVWIKNSTAIAKVITPEQIEHHIDNHQLHPCYLDSCFQVLVGLLKHDQNDHASSAAMIPVRVGRVLTYQQGEISWFRAKIKRQSPRSVLADFELYNHAGELVAQAQDCRFRAVQFGQTVHETDVFEYISLLKRNEHYKVKSAGINTKKLAQATEAILNTERQIKRRQSLYGEIAPLLDTLIACYAHETLSKYCDSCTENNTKDASNQLDFDDIFNSHGVEPRQQYLVSRLLQILQEQGWASNDSNNGNNSIWTLTDSDQIPDSHSVWLTLIGDYPGLMPEVLSAGRAGAKLGDILIGKLDVQTLLKPAHTSGIKDHLADTALSIQGTLNSALKVVEEWSQHKVEEHFRVLHLGGGQGRLCGRLVNLFPNNSDYLYLHSNTELCGKVETIFESYPQARVENIDFDSQEAWAEFLATQNQFDLVIVNDTLHHHTHPDRLLESLRTVMSQDGLLLCIEKNPSRLADITQGIDDDWWHRTINIENPIPLRLRADDWSELIHETGFANIEIINDDPGKHSGAYLLLAQNPTINATKVDTEQWLVVVDDQAECLQLINGLTSKISSETKLTFLQHSEEHNEVSESVDTNVDDNTDQNDRILLNLLNKDVTESAISNLNIRSYNKVVMACGISYNNDTLEEALNLRTITTLNLIQSFDQLSEEHRPELFLISRNGNTSLNKTSDKEKTQTTSKSIADTALWGLGRVIRNEHPELNCRQIDLQTTAKSSSINTLIAPLLSEISHPTEDFEVVLSITESKQTKSKNSVERYVLQMQPAKAKTPIKEFWDGDIKLDFSDPGLLKNLQWVPIQQHKPAEGQISVRPKASGLNFRDVMYAMGLLSDEAVESGFSGPTLGMEFAGEVIEVGPGVEDFKAGDSVMGFGPACFSTQLITEASATAIMPKNWLFEEAATIPTTFFTAYYALDHLARLQPGERILIHGGAGGVGIAAIQLAHHLGAEVFVTAGTDEKRDFVQFMGADHVLDSRSLNFADDIMRITDDEGIDVVLNSLAGEAINKNLRILRPFGRFLELGKRDFYENSRIGLRPFRNNISYFGIDADQLMVEKPQLTSRLFKDLMKIFEEGALRPLPYRCFSATRVEEAFRYMQQARQIGKILVTFDDLPQITNPEKDIQKPLELDSEGCYLVTGGLGGFGLETAKWLAHKGAKHLVLASRSGEPAESSLDSYAELKEMDVNLYCQSVDVTDKKALRTLFDTFGSELPELKGLVHAATVFEDSLLRNLDAEHMRKVLDPKVLGGWNLHQLTQKMALDFFVVYSSVTTFFGNPGQGNYVAANSALEGLVELRQQAALPGLFVAWGAISDVGFLARNEDVKDALQSRLGGSSLTSIEALDILEKLIISKRQGAAVMDMNWGPMKRFLPIAESNQYRILNWIAANQGDDDDQGEDIREILKGLNQEEALAKVAELLSREIGHILRIPADKLDQQSSVFDLGMDSLMGVELAMAVEKRFSVNMPAMALSEGPSIMRLSERIIQKLMGTEIETSTSSDDNVKRLASMHNEDLTDSGLEKITSKVQSADKPGSILH